MVSILGLFILAISGVANASQIEDQLVFKKGWNLIYGLSNPQLITLADQSFDVSHIKAIYGFNPITQEYVRVYPNPENDKFRSIRGQYIADTSFLVYSDVSVKTRYSLQKPWPLKYVYEHELYKGWNFFGIIPEFSDKKLVDVKGNCDILKSHAWDGRSQSWDNLPLEGNLNVNGDNVRNEVGGGHIMGMVLKVAKNCVLGETGSDIPDVP